MQLKNKFVHLEFTSVFKRCLEGNIGIRARGMAFLNVSATIEAEPVEFLFPNIVSSMVGAVREIL